MKLFEKKTGGIIAALVAGALIGGAATGVLAYSYSTDDLDKTVSDAISESASSEATDVVKDETVYVIAGADGSVQKVIVSDWLKNTLNAANISDYTELSDVTNVKGYESYSMDPDNLRVWDAQGNDIYYQGSIDKDLPVDLSVTYKLDGNPISAEDLAGKSGRVSIRFDYKNKQKQTVQIDGKNTNIYVPFVMLTGTILDNDHFKNVEVSNGKYINDGDRTVVVGFALPGMQQNLDISTDTFEIPDSVEITADATDFSLMTTLTVATNDVFNNLDLSGIDSADDLTDKLSTLDSSAMQLVNGSSDLYNGISTLLDKSGALITGIDQLAAGAEQLQSGSNELNSGSSYLSQKMQAMSQGLGQLVGNNDKLNGGAEQVFTTLLSTADTQIAAAGLTAPSLTIENYDTVLDGLVSALSDEALQQTANAKALETVTAAVNANKALIEGGVTAAVQQSVLTKVLASLPSPMTPEQYAAAVQAGQISAQQQAQIEGAVSQQMQSDTVKALIAQKVAETIQQKIDEQMASDTVKQQIAAGVAAGQKGRASLEALKGQLDSYNQFYQGILQYTAGVDQAKSGADQLAAGTQQLASGANELASGAGQLNSGIGELQSGSGALVGGVTQLQTGAMQLSEGMQQFYDEGVAKLVSLVNGDFANTITRLKATVDVSRDYKSFAGISDDTDGSVKFIYRTASIGE